MVLGSLAGQPGSCLGGPADLGDHSLILVGRPMMFVGKSVIFVGNSWFHTFGIPKALGTGHGLPLFEVLLQTIFGPPRFSWGIHHFWMSPFIKFMSARPPLAQPFSKHFGAIHQPLQKRKVYSCWNHRLCCLKPPEKRVLVRAKSRNISAVDHFWWVDYQFFMDKNHHLFGWLRPYFSRD